ncbi:MAG: choice-of-anchor J domain-containing protein, partial [bacterium]
MNHRVVLLTCLSLLCLIGTAFAGPRATRTGRPELVEPDHIAPPPAAEVDDWVAPANISQTPMNFEYSQYGHCRGVAVDTAGNVHVTWYVALTPTRVMYRKWTRATGTWGPAEQVSTSTTLSSYRGGVAVDHSGNVHVVWYRSAAPNSGVWYRMKSIATGTWGAEQRIATKYASGSLGEPSIAARPGGNQVHVVWTQRCSTGTAPTYPKAWHREFSGTAWGPITMVSADTASVAFEAGVAVDTANNAHVSWRQYADSSAWTRVWYRARIGGTWQTVEQVSPAGFDNYSQYNPDIEVTAGGTPHVAWHGVNPAGASKYRVYYRNRSGGTWGELDTVSRYNSEHNSHPSLALASDTVHLAWRRYNDGSTIYTHTRYRRRLPAGGWGADVRLSPAAWTSTAYYSTIAADRGDVHLVWYDTWNGMSATYNDVWYLRRVADPDVDFAAASIDSIWPFVPHAGTARVAATVHNSGRLNQPAGKRVILRITGPGAYAYSDTALTANGVLAGDSTPVVFSPDWTIPDQRGIYTLTVITDLDGDQNPANDTTRRDVEVYPGLYETFSGEVFPPRNWRVYNFDESDPWIRHTSYSFTAPACAQIRFDTPNNDWLITPKLGPIDVNDDSLAFMFRADERNYYETLTVRLSTTSGTDTAAFSTVVGEYISYDTVAWRRLAFDLSAYRDSTVYLAFVYKDYDNFGVAIDDVMGPKVYWPLSDVTVEAARAVTYPLAFGAAETVAASVYNLGRNSTDPFKVRLNLNGAPLDSADVAGLAIGDSVTVRFALDLSMVARARFTICANLPGDEVVTNDTAWFDDWVFPRNTYAAQGFDQPHAGTFPPAGWVRLNLDGGTRQWEWRAEQGGEHSGQRHAGVWWESTTLRNDDWLITGPVTPSATGTDTFGFFWRAYDAEYPESLEVYAMRGQSGPSDTISLLYARQDTATTYQAVKLILDAYDDSLIYLGFRCRSLDAYILLIDDAWWQITRGGPDAPLLAAPPDRADSQPYSGRLTWHPAFNADVYDVWLDTVSPPVTRIAEGITDTTAEYAGLLPWRDYYWRVDARNSAGRTVSLVWSFTTIGPDPTPRGWLEVAQVPLAPSGRAVKDGGWIAWDELTGRHYIAKGYKTGDFYSWDPASGTWAELAAWPLGVEAKPPYKGSVGVSDGNGVIYATKGNNKSGFWKYSALDSTWTQLADVPLGLSNKKVKGGTDLVYVLDDTTGWVYLLKGYKCEFYRYNVNTGTWHALADAPTGIKNKYDKGSWLAYDEPNRKLYAHKAKFMELYSYSLDSAAWSPLLPGMPLANNQTTKSKKAKDGSDAVVLYGSIFTLKGGNTI